MQLAELAAVGKLHGELEIGDAAPLGAGLEDPAEMVLMLEKYTADRGAGPRSGEHGRSPQVADRERENARPMLTMTAMKHQFDGSW